jgi:hypothetical protein
MWFIDWIKSDKGALGYRKSSFGDGNARGGAPLLPTE